MIIGSIGIGLFILILLWAITLAVFVLGIKFQNNVAWVALASAATITIILVLIPVETKTQTIEKASEKDYGLIYRGIFLTFLVLSALVGFVVFFLCHCIEPVRAKFIKNVS